MLRLSAAPDNPVVARAGQVAVFEPGALAVKWVGQGKIERDREWASHGRGLRPFVTRRNSIWRYQLTQIQLMLELRANAISPLPSKVSRPELD